MYQKQQKPRELEKLNNMGVTITFRIAGKTIGSISTSLESFDSSPHLIPKRIINKISNTNYAVEIMFHVEQSVNNTK